MLIITTRCHHIRPLLKCWQLCVRPAYSLVLFRLPRRAGEKEIGDLRAEISLMLSSGVMMSRMLPGAGWLPAGTRAIMQAEAGNTLDVR